jgi:hypothetical protein
MKLYYFVITDKDNRMHWESCWAKNDKQAAHKMRLQYNKAKDITLQSSSQDYIQFHELTHH